MAAGFFLIVFLPTAYGGYNPPRDTVVQRFSTHQGCDFGAHIFPPSFRGRCMAVEEFYRKYPWTNPHPPGPN